jgi:transposase-like protein
MENKSAEVDRSGRRKKRNFSPEFKADAVRLVLEEKQTVAEVARDLDLTHSSLRNWVKQKQIDAGHGKPEEPTTDEILELRRLRKENRVLKMERDILKKATAFFVKENP